MREAVMDVPGGTGAGLANAGSGKLSRSWPVSRSPGQNPEANPDETVDRQDRTGSYTPDRLATDHSTADILLESLLLGRSPAMQALRRDVRALGPSTANVLLLGPTGAGKDMVARALHACGLRADARFEAINCGAIPAELAEAELFGAEAGAYTGASRARAGRFEAANGGTLFLDEVADLPLALQVKLLRVLESRTVERLGGSKAIPLDIRVIAATNADLEKAVAEGRFRADLYWRLAVVAVEVPPLSARREDLPLLIRHFAERSGCALTLLPCGETALSRHDWPGNVRELRNLVERAAALGETVLDQAAVARMLRPARRAMTDWLQGREAAEPVRQPGGPARGFQRAGPLPDGALKALMAEVEQALIAQALEEANGTIAEAGRILGMKRTTLTEKMRRMGLKAANEAA